MVVARWQGTIVDDAGTVVSGASVAVVSETTGGLATIYSDRAGLVSITNPTTTDSDGFVGFYAAGDAYKITATKAGTTREFRYVGIGTSQEEDKPLVTILEVTFSGVGSLVIGPNLDLYREIVFEFERLQVLTDLADMHMFLSIDGVPTFITGTSNLYTLDRRTVATPALVGSTGTSELVLATNMGTGTGEFYNGIITMLNHADTSTFKTINSTATVLDATPDFRASNLAGMVQVGGSVQHAAFQPSTGNMNGKLIVKGELI